MADPENDNDSFIDIPRSLVFQYTIEFIGFTTKASETIWT